jgi:hypothetical protein
VGKIIILVVLAILLTGCAPKRQPPTVFSPVSYSELARETEAWVGRGVALQGQVVQVIEDGNEQQLRVNITKGAYFWTDTVFVWYANGPRLLEGDLITFTAEVLGRLTYKSVLGASITLPELYVYRLTRLP